MSSRIFQGVIVQMKDATTRCIGVVDEQGFVIACSELSMIGSRLDDFQAAVGEVQEQLFSTDARTYKILSASTARETSVVKCSSLARTYTSPGRILSEMMFFTKVALSCFSS